MITINDNDLPITVAEKIITATVEIDNELTKAVNKAVGGEGKKDQYSLEEIKEIADYLWVYCKTHEDGD